MPDPSFLGSPLPLIQAPMAGAQDARLALAAGRAGALGSLPAAILGADALGLDHFMPLWSGSNRSGCREAPAAEVVRTLAAGFAA
jgi:NAD(P)H-dependent flavin oxidoreductase YrpB (nitropropane dioxygenase family)